MRFLVGPSAVHLSLSSIDLDLMRCNWWKKSELWYRIEDTIIMELYAQCVFNKNETTAVLLYLCLEDSRLFSARQGTSSLLVTRCYPEAL
jgi:hypothetical protein